MSIDFNFPDDLYDLTLARLDIDRDSVAVFKAQLPQGIGMDRISDISLKVKGRSCEMRFCLDGRRIGKCLIDDAWQAWLDAGLVSLYELALHFCISIKPGFSRQPVQRTLFS